MLPINCHKMYGDVTITVYHAKSLLGTEKITTTKVFQLQFHTAFAHLDQSSNGSLRFNKLAHAHTHT